MTKRRVFYSFHYDNDVMRTQQIRNMGYFDGDEPVTPNRWEEIKRSGDQAIRNWIDKTMESCSCLVVLVGSETADRKWVKYEIERAWNTNKGVLGIYIHNLKDPRYGTCNKGYNPFYNFTIGNGFNKQRLSDIVTCYDPIPYCANEDIKNKIEILVEEAIAIRQRH